MSDGNMYDWLAMQQVVLPEWVGGAGKSAHYAPPDIGSQATQLNYVQDIMGTPANPLMMWLAGQMDGGSLASTYEEDEVIPGVTAGRDFLTNVINTSPDTIEGLIAEHILAGGSPIEAVKLAEQSGLIKPSMRDAYHQGQKVGQEPDTSERDYYIKWATDAQNRLFQDKEEQRTPGKEILHPFVQEMINAGFTDPRQTYSADYLNPDLGRMDEKVAGQRAPLDAALKSRDAMSKYVGEQRQRPAAERPQQDWWTNALPKGDNLGQMVDMKGEAIFEPLGLGGMGPFSRPQNLTALVPRGEPTTPRGSAVDAANLFEARMAGSYKNDPNRAALAKRAEGVGRKAQQLNMGHARDKNTASLERIKAQAVSNYLGQQGRTPAMDQYAAAMAALKQRISPVNGI